MTSLFKHNTDEQMVTLHAGSLDFSQDRMSNDSLSSFSAWNACVTGLRNALLWMSLVGVFIPPTDVALH